MKSFSGSDNRYRGREPLWNLTTVTHDPRYTQEHGYSHSTLASVGVQSNSLLVLWMNSLWPHVTKAISVSVPSILQFSLSYFSFPTNYTNHRHLRNHSYMFICGLFCLFAHKLHGSICSFHYRAQSGSLVSVNKEMNECSLSPTSI